jgi:hypothetical protein
MRSDEDHSIEGLKELGIADGAKKTTNSKPVAVRTQGQLSGQRESCSIDAPTVLSLSNDGISGEGDFSLPLPGGGLYRLRYSRGVTLMFSNFN